MNPPHPTALIAEDEPLLARALQVALSSAWPDLRVVATVGDGVTATAQALALLPDVLFLDIRMPGRDGLSAAAALADAWPAHRPYPALVFVTAYDRYAVEAFEAQAVDYLLKPVQPQRLQRCVARLRQVLAQRLAGAGADDTLAQLRLLLDGQPAARPPADPLKFLPAAETGTQGAVVRMVPVAAVLVFEAADKYVRVLTAGAEYLVRMPLRELSEQLDAQVFWRIHRGTLVRADAIDTVVRDAAGRLSLAMHGRSERWTVSRLYAQPFRAL
ncbi:response regulator [Xylophilus sp. Kf1]|nr:response regulator [Xylophilus sp. Kf1]